MTFKNEIVDDLKNNRVKNSATNLKFGITASIVTSVFPFIIRMIMVRYLGDELLGLNSVMNSTILTLNMAELGLGSVIVFFLYEPVAKGNIELLNQYLSEIRNLYQRIALVIFTIGMVVLIFIPHLVGSAWVGKVNSRITFFIYLMSICLQYILWAESGIILTVYQRISSQHRASIISNSSMYILQILAICIVRSFYLYVLLVLAQSIVYAILQRQIVNRKYPDLKPKGELSLERKIKIKKKIIPMIGHQLDEKLFYNVDTVFVSIFRGLRYASIYGNYLCVIYAVSFISSIVYSSMISSVGNALVVETIESNKSRFECVLFISGVIAGGTTACLVSLFQPFMQIWMPNMLLSEDAMICFCVFLYFIQIRRSVQTFKNAAGLWEKDKFKPYISIIIDIILNLLLIPAWGIKGAVISSVICIGGIELPWEAMVLYRELFNSSIKDFWIRFTKYTLVNSFISVVLYCIIQLLILNNSLLGLVVKSVLSVLIVSLLYICCYSREPEYLIWKDTIIGLLQENRKKKGGIYR